MADKSGGYNGKSRCNPSSKDITRLSALHIKLSLAKSTAKEFENGNTFVRIADDLTAENVVVILPEILSPDALMKSLITISQPVMRAPVGSP